MDFERMYSEFGLTTENAEALHLLSDATWGAPRPAKRVLVETVIVENGTLRVIKREEQGAELV